MSEEREKTYLGDGAYADFDGYYIVLTTEDGTCAQNTIYLEPIVLSALIRYISEKMPGIIPSNE